jgi:hypothetical protein
MRLMRPDAPLTLSVRAELERQTAIADGVLTAIEVEAFIAPYQKLLRTDSAFRERVAAIPLVWAPQTQVDVEAQKTLNALLDANPVIPAQEMRAHADADLATATSDGRLTLTEVEELISPYQKLMDRDLGYRERIATIPYVWDPLTNVDADAQTAIDDLMLSVVAH